MAGTQPLARPQASGTHQGNCTAVLPSMQTVLLPGAWAVRSTTAPRIREPLKTNLKEVPDGRGQAARAPPGLRDAYG